MLSASSYPRSEWTAASTSLGGCRGSVKEPPMQDRQGRQRGVAKRFDERPEGFQDCTSVTQRRTRLRRILTTGIDRIPAALKPSPEPPPKGPRLRNLTAQQDRAERMLFRLGARSEAASRPRGPRSDPSRTPPRMSPTQPPANRDMPMVTWASSARPRCQRAAVGRAIGGNIEIGDLLRGIFPTPPWRSRP